VSKVDFFDGATLAATVTAAPYSATLASLPPGTHVLTARATDNLGVSTTSAAVTIRVDAPPGVNITAPANNAVFTAPANITITATATDTDGKVTKVDFFDGTTLIGTATAAPYSVTLANAALGSHGFTARATDDLGAVTTSSAVSVVVNAAPTVAITSPTSGASFVAPANITLTATAADSDGTVQKVEFFQGGTNLIATATSARYTVNWSSAAPGSYSVTAVATDNRNATTTSAPVSVTVVANALPTVSITSPTSGGNFSAPANITVAATALDSDGTIQKVEFFQGGANLIATLTAPPYSFTWTAVPQGTYSLTAVATDNLNGTRTSAPVSVTVDRAPALNFVHVDHLNTPRLVADAAGTTVWKWDQQEPFGNNVADENPSGLGAFDLPLRLPGQYFDKETNLHYNYFRDYDPSLARYGESDPIGLAGGINTYGYVKGAPLWHSDPRGLYGLPWEMPPNFNVPCALNPSACTPPFNETNCFVRCTIVSVGLGMPFEAAAEQVVHRVTEDLARASCKVVLKAFFLVENVHGVSTCYRTCYECQGRSCPVPDRPWNDPSNPDFPRIPPLANPVRGSPL
jgi:RHS repeat-associated protein